MQQTDDSELPHLRKPDIISKWKVKVTAVSEANKIFVRFIEYEEKLKKMVEDMKKFYTTYPRRVTQVCSNRLYVAVSATKAARIRVLSVNNDLVNSYFVDCGFSRVLKLSAIHEMDQRFKELPEQAFELELWAVEHTDAAMEYISEIIDARVDQVFIARAIQKASQKYGVQLYFDANSDSDTLSDEKCINVCVNRFMARKDIELLMSRHHSYIDVYITHCIARDGDCLVSVQVNDQYSQKLNENQRDIDIKCERFGRTVDIRFIDFKRLYYVKSSGNWRRIKVLNMCDEFFDVYFVDYGYNDFVNVSDIKELDELMDTNRFLPFLAVTVSLPPKNEPWSAIEAAQVMEFFDNSIALMYIEEVTNGDRMYPLVNLFKPLTSIFDKTQLCKSNSSTSLKGYQNGLHKQLISSSNFNVGFYKVFSDK